jgi:hypothetical protein
VSDARLIRRSLGMVGGAAVIPRPLDGLILRIYAFSYKNMTAEIGRRRGS